MKLTIVIPTHNEEAVILKPLKRLAASVYTTHEIVVVDDSKDSTPQMVKKYLKKVPNIRLVTGGKISFGQALGLGYKSAKGDAFVVVMGDLCDDPKTIDKMFNKLNSGWDVVCGSRYMKGGKKVGGPKLQGLLSELVCRSLKILTGVPTSDVSNAFKMYKIKTLKGVRFNKKSGVEASMETLLQVYFKGAAICEIPTVWLGRSRGESKFNIFARTPRYSRIYVWALVNAVRKLMHVPSNKFYA